MAVYLTVGRVSQVEATTTDMIFQRVVTDMSQEKLVELGSDDRVPTDPMYPTSPLYVTLLNKSPGVNADLTITLLSDPGLFGLGAGGYAM